MNKIRDIKEKQAKIAAEYTQILEEFNIEAVIEENVSAKKRIETLIEKNSRLEQTIRQVKQENESLRLSLHEQILDEKLNILKISREKLETYFSRQLQPAANRLTEWENQSRAKIEQLKNAVLKELKEDQAQFQAELDRLAAEIARAIETERREQARAKEQSWQSILAEYDDLAREKLDEAAIKRRVRQNRIEMKIGLHWLNKIGIVFIILAVGLFAYYNRSEISDIAKSMLFLAGGLAFLVAGEILYRKKLQIFALSALGGGFAVLYAAVFFSYFLLHTFSLNVALVFSVLITLAALLLAIRYNSKTVIILSLIGGFLPFLSFAWNRQFSGSGYYLGMGYLLIFNLLVLAVSFWKKWSITHYFSFFLNVPALVYLVFNCDQPIYGILYSAITFAMYMMIILAFPFIYQTRLKGADFILLGLNTFVSTLIIYGLLAKLKMLHLAGLLALLFCLIYAGLGWLARKLIYKEPLTRLIFYLTAITFAVLMIPFQFEIQWLSLGWLIESVLLIIAGYRKKIKLLERSGWIIFGLCLGIFIFYDFLFHLDSHLIGLLDSSHFFFFKYLAVTIGLNLVLFVYQYDLLKGKLALFSAQGKLIIKFKYFVLIHTYIFCNYMVIKYSGKWFFLSQIMDWFFFTRILLALVSLLFAYLFTHFRLISDRVTRGMAIILQIINLLICLNLLVTAPVLQAQAIILPARILSLLILIGFNVLVMLNLRQLILKFVKSRQISLEAYPIIFSLILLGNITLYLTVQFELTHLDLLISVIFMALAAGCIIYGFIRKFLYIRIFGLSLIVLALCKLFFYDLRYLTDLLRILAYLVFGLILIGLSLLYQIVNKKLKQPVDETGDLKTGQEKETKDED